VLKEEIAQLDTYEKTIEQHKQWCQQSVKNITEDPTNAQLSYVSSDTISSAFDGDTLLTVQAPSGTLLEVPKPEFRRETGKIHGQIHLKSDEGQIYVVLVNRNTDSEEAVVMQVPPPPQEDEDEISVEKELNEEEAAVAVVAMQTTRGRGKSKATSPPETSSPPPAKRVNKTAVEESESDKRAAKEVESILSGAGGLDIPGLDELVGSSELFGPLMRLSPPTTDRDYCFNLDDSEGACDLFDAI
jgi:transcription factor E2F4/5